MKLALFASGTGSNAEVLIRSAQAGELSGEVALVISDKPSAPVLAKAQALGVKTVAIRPTSFQNKAEYEQELVSRLQSEEVDLVVLAGYMRLIGPVLLSAYEGKIINIHPSLLPSFPGLDAIGQALQADVTVTGVTIHYVDAGMDTGPIIAQREVPLVEGETHETLAKKIQAVEHKLYPTVVNQLLHEKLGEES
ncbi:phosphoribosylglycinamide formyltransferase [Shouchella patagoniensis]|uniref:phosphoribosylglycinamide formyltransferase n=1 Tax=Shouchella patagoniensis TaxID=228576 RepID=UPI000995514E|nr:phosphoribosylglycinamide formyltransferase [Shouchella patagoniensis]